MRRSSLINGALISILPLSNFYQMRVEMSTKLIFFAHILLSLMYESKIMAAVSLGGGHRSCFYKWVIKEKLQARVFSCEVLRNF